MYFCGGVMKVLLSFALFVERVFATMRAILVELEAAGVILGRLLKLGNSLRSTPSKSKKPFPYPYLLS
jgi:hypothetical protein